MSDEIRNGIVCFDNDPGKFESFSNWFRAPFTYAGRTYSSIETYMMIQKVELFDEYGLAEKIAEADDAAEAKKIGRTPMAKFNPQLWSKAGYNVVKRGVRAKFQQYPEYAEVLINTGEDLIAECNAADPIWGIALALDDERRFDVSCWAGTNQLGRILMEVREELSSLSEYVDMTEAETDKWNESPARLMRNPKYMGAVETYFCTLDDKQQEIFLGLSDFTYDERLPKAGFAEMKQEILDISRR